VIVLAASLSMAETRIWGGGGTNNLASTTNNWVGGVAPVAGNAIVLDATTNKNMTWDMNIPLSSWTQAGYTGTVTVATIYGATGFTNFNIAGDCVISNGVWTQIANPAVNYESNRLCATIGGNLTVGMDASINVTGKGYTTLKGPGSGVSPPTAQAAVMGGTGFSAVRATARSRHRRIWAAADTGLPAAARLSGSPKRRRETSSASTDFQFQAMSFRRMKSVLLSTPLTGGDSVVAGGDPHTPAELAREVVAVGETAFVGRFGNPDVGVPQQLRGPADSHADEVFDRGASHDLVKSAGQGALGHSRQSGEPG
jgi:hypothetical protein